MHEIISKIYETEDQLTGSVSLFHARRSLSTVGRDTVANQPPHYCPPLIHLHSPPPAEQYKVSQQVWNRVMN